METKLCPKCEQILPPDAFGTRKRRCKNGEITHTIHSWCIGCRNLDAKLRRREERSTLDGRKKNREKVYAYRERIGGRRAARHNQSVIFEGVKMKYGEALKIKNDRKLAEREAKRIEREKKSEIRKKQREHERQNRIAAKPWSDPSISEAEKFRLRYRLDPEFNIKQRIRASLRRKRQGAKIGDLIRTAIKRNGSSPKFEEFAGYTAKDLRVHLEKQFTKGMTWERFNAGEIHIDHIVPLSSFDLHNPDQLKAAWSITNLRPLWAKDNLSKGRKLDFMI